MIIDNRYGIKGMFSLAMCALALTACGGGGGGGGGGSGGGGLGSTAIIAVEQGRAHACGLLDNGSVRCWGNNDSGQLGLGQTINHRGDDAGEMGDNLPEVNLGSGVWAVQVRNGEQHTCALLNTGNVKCWGRNFNGQLGNEGDRNPGDDPGEMGNALQTVALGTGRTATAIAVGAYHTCALLDDHSIKCWGSNTSGQLGMGDRITRGDDPGEMGDALPAIDLGTGRTATAVATGSAHSCALLDNASVKCWGTGVYGVLGTGTASSHGQYPNEMGDNLPAVDLGTGRTAIAIAAANYQTCALLDNNSVKCWGYNFYGQLGLGATDNRGDQAGEMGDTLPAVDLGTGRTAIAIAMGREHTCALLDNNGVKCWGRSIWGQLGLGIRDTRGDQLGEMGDALPAVNLGTGRSATAIAAAGDRTCALLNNSGLKCWGYNVFGQLGLETTDTRGDQLGEMGDALPYVDLGTGLYATAIAMGGYHNCALLSNSGLKCWGNNYHGQLGLGDPYRPGDEVGELTTLPAVDLGNGRTTVAIATGSDHSCALLDDGSVKCWGSNSNGQLGLGDSNIRGDDAGEMGDALPAIDLGTNRTATAIATGAEHSCALLDDGSVKCWGYNFSGQLGLGDINDHGNNAGEMGDALPAVDLGTGRTAIAITAGSNHTCALLDDSSVKCWGYNGVGQLGLGTTDARGDQAGEMGDALPAVDLGTGRTATAITVGESHTCALLDDNSVKCWGYNSVGQLGLGTTDARGDQAGEMGDALPAVDLGSGRTATAIATGSTHSCALLDTNAVKCWGDNGYGQLGQGHWRNLGSVPSHMGDNLLAIDLGGGLSANRISAGYDQTCALLSNNMAKCWGYNDYGQLGAGKIHHLGDDADEMGDNLPALVF